MKIAVMGAGAVGCYYGGMLARAGHAVTLIGRLRHVEAVRRDGLLLETRTLREFVPARADTDAGAVSGAGLVLFCVKSTDTEHAGSDMAPHLEPGVVVLGLQNGVDNAQRLQAVLGRDVVPALVYVAAREPRPVRGGQAAGGTLRTGAGGDEPAVRTASGASPICPWHGRVDCARRWTCPRPGQCASRAFVTNDRE